MHALERSYRYCREVARRRAKNFYYSFLLLPRAQRDAMCAVYAFMRYCDDLSDEPGASRAAIDGWRRALDAALAGRYGEHPAWPAFHDTVRRYCIPHQYFYEMIEGVASDLEPRRVATFDELYRYCYQVASVVGLTTIHIFGFESAQAPGLAEKCGVAFQLTNILRDVREDAGRGRIYLPAEDLARFGLAERDVREPRPTPALAALLGFEIERARAYYAAARPLVGLVDRRSRPSLRALIAIYSRLLDRIERSGCEVFSRRIALPAVEKAWLVVRALAR
jgi:phytoene synthase